MKKIFFAFAVIVLAIASYGGINLNARAATLTPDQIAAFEARIEAMRATALNLSSAAAAVSVSQNTPPSVMMTLSPQEVAEINVALDSLKAVLVTLQTQFATDPQLADQNLPMTIASLKSIGTTLAAITGTLGASHGLAIASAPASAPAPATHVSAAAPVPAQTGPKPVAQAAPSAPARANAPAADNIAPATPLLSANQPANAETAQAASTWSWKNLNWPLVVVILFAVLAIGSWIFWPEGKGSAKGKGPQKPAAPSPSVLVSTAHQPRPTVVITPVKQDSAPQTPLSASMSMPVIPKPPLQQQQQQQRKPA